MTKSGIIFAMADSVNNKIQFQLRKLQRQPMQSQDDAITDDVEALPKWISTLPQIYSVTDEFDELLKQLPAMQAAPERITKQIYFKKLVEELVKIYYYRLRIVQLSDKITDKQKPLDEATLIQECKETVAQLANWLEVSTNGPAA